MSQHGYIEEITVARAIAIMGVIIVHSFSEAVFSMQGTDLFGFYNFINIFFRIGTTTFIMLSAFGLFYSYYRKPFTKSLMIHFYRKRFLYILIPYTLFSIVYFYLNNHMLFESHSRRYLAGEFLQDLLTGRAHTHLYFVFISVQFFALFPILLFIFQKLPKLTHFLIPLGLFLQWSFVIYNNLILQNVTPGNLSIWYLSFFFTGAYLGIHFDKISWFLKAQWKTLFTKQKILLLSFWLFWVLSASAHVYIIHIYRLGAPGMDSRVITLLWNLHTLTTAIIILQLSFFLHRILHGRIMKSITAIGTMSFGLYIFHPIVLHFYRYTPIPGDTLLYQFWLLGGFIATLVISILVVTLTLRYVKYSWILFGQVKQEKK